MPSDANVWANRPIPEFVSVSGSPASSGGIPLTVWLISALAIGLQALLFYRRRRLVLKQREAKKRGSTTLK